MKRADGRTLIALCLFMSSCFITGEWAVPRLSPVRPALAEENWKAEFDAVCGKSDESMGMTRDELKALMARCDKLKPLIEAQEETTRKVYLKRLQMCRDLLAYVLEVKSRN